MSHKCFLNWSGGKDSTLALHRLMSDPDWEVHTLFTTMGQATGKVAMHEVNRDLLQRQADAIGIPLKILDLPEQPSMEEYNSLMKEALGKLKDKGLTHSVYGDIFLEDLRIYRESQLKAVGVKAHFPLWKEDTGKLMQEFLELGFKTIVVSVNADFLDQSFCGRIIDHQFLKDLPKDVDPCGENGEYHTFVFDGPIFKNPVPFNKGSVYYKTYPSPTDAGEEAGFWIQDLS